MTWQADDILALRLRNQYLTRPFSGEITDLVAHLGAVQAQDYPAAKWALGLRLRGATHASLEKAFAEGKLLRTHVLRPTWHFVAPADIRWMLELTGPRIKQAMAGHSRSLGLDDETFACAFRVIVRALEGGHSLTRNELASPLRDAGVSLGDPSAIGHVTSLAELAGLVCSGPPRGLQQTYALLEERVAPAARLERDEAIAELTWRYFQSHGPALPRDCSWWSGLTLTEVRRGLAMNSHRLTSMTFEGSDYWFANRGPAELSETVHLLPNFDEYTVAYRARDLYYDRESNRTGNERLDVPFADVIVADGRVAGRWKCSPRQTPKNMGSHWSIEPSCTAERELELAHQRYAEFYASR
jgi:hypothetical protein